jgi:drug/metabolite transporter (DMT)-like permease
LHPLAVGLVLLSAVSHVCWNYHVKRSPAPALFTWWIQALGAVLVAPLGVWLAWPVTIPRAAWYCVGGTALFYAGYFTLIARSYGRADLSRAYPIARGVAPAATALWGVLFFGEMPSLGGWLGIAAIVLGVLLLAGATLRPSTDGLATAGLLAAVGTGLCTSGYSVVDKAGVQYVMPVLYLTLTFAAGALTQGLFLLPRWGWRAFAAEAQRGGWRLVLSAALSAGGYLLILTVLRTEPVSYVVPLRSVSVLLSVLTGAHFLGEKGSRLRLGAAALIVLGITGIAVLGRH